MGEKHITNDGCEVEIIEYFGSLNCTVRFRDEKGVILYNQQYSNISKGQAVNPYYYSVCGVGYFGEGMYKAWDNENKKHFKYYTLWRGMLMRCYDKAIQEKLPTYKDVTVCEEWKCLQNFAKWYEENYNTEIMESWQLDKDILIKGNKIYSPDTCCFVPHEINMLFVAGKNNRGECPIGVYKCKDKYRVQISIMGNRAIYLGTFNTKEEAFQAYKTAKEAYIKEIADKWKSQITEECYKAMINYKVEITD